MFLVGMLSWWYGSGWRGQFGRVRERLKATAAFFSIGQLAKTWFAPFRQISADSGGGSFGAMIRGFFDKLLSRIIGAIVRTFTMLFGIIALIFQAIYEAIILVVWLILPAFPVVGLLLMAIGWVPKWM